LQTIEGLLFLHLTNSLTAKDLLKALVITGITSDFGLNTTNCVSPELFAWEGKLFFFQGQAYTRLANSEHRKNEVLVISLNQDISEKKPSGAKEFTKK
jgi:hypothetical protein